MRYSVAEKYHHILSIFNGGCAPGDMKHEEFAGVTDPKASTDSIVKWAKDVTNKLKGNQDAQ